MKSNNRSSHPENPKIGRIGVQAIFAAIFGFALCFAQEPPGKLAVYVSGAGDGGINKSLSNKLLAAMSQGGNYAEIADPAVFQDELAKSGSIGLAQVAQAAKRYGADYVCAVSMTEAFGAYSITARMAKTHDYQVLKTASVDRSIKSLDDLAAVSKELSRQLLNSNPAAAAALPPVDAAPPPVKAAPPPAPPGECERIYNKNELLYKVKHGFPSQLKDCSAKLAKEMALASLPFGKKASPVEPKSFMKQCAVDGVKKELPEGFPNKDKIVGRLDNFLQGILNAASAGAGLDPMKLVSAVGNISAGMDSLTSDVKKLAADECVVDEPYEPPSEHPPAEVEQGAEEKAGSAVSFGIRAGFNYSHTYTEYSIQGYNGNYYYKHGGEGNYDDVLGLQFGFVADFALSSWFHLQPGLMYVQKGLQDGHESFTVHYLELPLLLSLKLSALRLNAGPYAGISLMSDIGSHIDYGISTGFGFDIGLFYIGAFYEHGLSGLNSHYGNHYYGSRENTSYNRTLGFNLGVNL